MALPPQFNHLAKLNVRCPNCSNLFDFQRLQILGERDQQVLTYIDCAVCGTSLMSILSLTPAGMTAQGLVTDLVADEIPAVENETPLNHDDVLELYNTLERDATLFFKHP